MPRDDIDHIPAIVPARDHDEAPRAGGRAARGGTSPRGSRGPARTPPAARPGMGLLGRLLLTLSLVVAAVACAWAWQLQVQLREAQATLEQYATRIGDLEDRLSDTDEGMNQNATVQAAKIRELDSEVRKLWDNVWKQAKERLAALESSSKSYSGKIAANEKSLKSLQGKVAGAEGDLKKLRSVAGDLSRLASSAKTNQAEVERVADALNRVELDVAKLNRQVQSNAEAVKATDAFRRQVNSDLSNLEASVRALSAKPSL